MLRRVTGALVIALALTVCLFFLMGPYGRTAQANPSIHYVAPGGNCNGASPCYAVVQEAVDAANPGDEVRVAAGTYSDMNTHGGWKQIVYIDKNVAMQGGFTPANWTTSDPTANPTVLDAQNQGRVMVIAGGTDVSVDGFELTGGNASALGPTWNDVGGGLYVRYATATVRNSTISSSTTGIYSYGYGGGVHASGSIFTMIDSTVRDNTVSLMGGGRGGGIHATASDVTLSGSTISNNSASANGGGLCVYGGDMVIEQSTVSGNVTVGTGSGAGLYLYDSNAQLSGNLFIFNDSAWNAGGIWMKYGDTVLLTNNVFNRNRAEVYGGGIYVETSAPQLRHNTFSQNGGGEMVGGYSTALYVTDDWYNPSDVTMTNTIIVSHTVGISVTEGSTVTLDSTFWHNWYSNWDGDGAVVSTNHVSGSPVFEADGYHLVAGSPAIDAGVDAGVTLDIDEQVRPWGSAPDIGADEYGSAQATPTATPTATWTPTVTPTATPGSSPTPTATPTPILACQEDAFEDNDSCQDAGPLAAGNYPVLKICPLDDDWYAIDLASADTIEVTMDLDNAQGDLDMALYGNDCVTLLKQSTSGSDQEHFIYVAPAAGSYHLRVYAYTRADNDYDLQVGVLSGDQTYLPLIRKRK